jgi:superfamily I DNA/RNA helicase
LHLVVDAWQITTWDEYKCCARIGRKSRISEQQRALLWSIFEKVRAELRKTDSITNAEMFVHLANALANARHHSYDYAIVDEAQDINISHLRFFAALAGSRANGLFFAADIGQRIFQPPFSWRSLGIDIRGRSRTLRVNYRTSSEIRTQADKLLDPELTDFDGNSDIRSDTISLFSGPNPLVKTFGSQEEERQWAAEWLQHRLDDGVTTAEIALFVRSEDQFARVSAVLESVGTAYRLLSEEVSHCPSVVTVGTMHQAKGLEFRCVLVLACDDDIVPLRSRIESVDDEAELREIYNTERHLIYVACTRARDYLFVSGVNPVSEFLDDLKV